MGKQVASSNLVSKGNDRIYMIKKLLMASKNLRQKGPFDYFLTGILSGNLCTLKITYFILWIGGTMCQFISCLAFVIKKRKTNKKGLRQRSMKRQCLYPGKPSA